MVSGTSAITRLLHFARNWRMVPERIICCFKHMDYYSARLFVICLVDDGKPRRRNTCDYPFIVFRAKDREHALERALALGKDQETRYKIHEGQWVRWALVQVEAINRLGRRLDGIEIGSLLDVHRSARPIPFRKRFHPAKSRVIYY